MKNVSGALTGRLRNAHAVKALPKVIVDWNLNRYHDTRVRNTPDDQYTGFDIELFPIESITEPLRPSKGINKARVGHGAVTGEYQHAVGGMNSRFYLASVDDKYKYWTSPLPAVANVIPLFTTGNFPASEYEGVTGHDGGTSARPSVEYGEWVETLDVDGEVINKTWNAGAVQANKIVIKLENSWASPDDFDVQITRATSSVNISGNVFTGWEASGELVMYWNGYSWSTTSGVVHDANGMPQTDTVKKVQLVVRTMKGGYQKDGTRSTFKDRAGVEHFTNGNDSYLDVIEIAAHLEADLTPWVVSVDDSVELAEASSLYPIGTITSNQGSVNLFNGYTNSAGEDVGGLFSEDNTEIIWHKYMEPNAEVNISYVYYDEDDVEIDEVQQAVMYSDDWAGQSDDSVSLTLLDYSKFLNEITVPAAMWENLTVPEIVWRLLDSIGFVDYKVESADTLTDFTIPVFWVNGEDSVWTVLDELAKASQSAIYFDHEGILQIKTRDAAFHPGTEPVMKLQSYDNQDGLANIVSLSQEGAFEPNSIKVAYTTTNWSAWNNGQPSMQKVWEPEGSTVTLRASPLVRDMAADASAFWISPAAAKHWPYEGLVNIQGEIIRYAGKHWVYYTGANGTVRNGVYVKSEEERKTIERTKTSPGFRAKSHFSGAMKVVRNDDGTLERGVWNSEPRTHNTEASGYSVRHVVNGSRRFDVTGFAHMPQESKVQLKTPARFNQYRDLLIATRGGALDTPFYHYGTKFRFVKEAGRAHQTAGLVLHNNDGSEDGYYIEFVPSRTLNAKKRKVRNEMIVYSVVNGKRYKVNGKGVALAIGENLDYEVDVTYANINDIHTLNIWVNGRHVMKAGIGGSRRNSANGRFGMFARGKTKVRYEYLYGIKNPAPDPPDDFSFLDKVERGYTGNQWDREWVYSWRSYKRRVKRRWIKAHKRYNNRFFDEFGPIVHEVREFDVKFDPSPVLHSRLYLTNDWSGCVLEYNSTPYGAKFIIANTSRKTAVIHGDDSASFSGTGASVNQVLTVLGRGLVTAEAETVLAENTDQIRIRGKHEAELASPWIQNKATARALADWIRKHWTYNNEIYSVEIFGNPVIQVSDVVELSYPEKHISGDFFVTAVSTSFDNGIKTTLTLRRRV